MPAVVYDPDRTPPGSGMHRIMKEVCEQSIDRLVSWGESKKTAKDRDVRQAAEALLAIADEFSALLQYVNTWDQHEPTPEAKKSAINEILRHRDVSIQILKRHGATL